MRSGRCVSVLMLLLGSARAGFPTDWIEVRSPNFRVITDTSEKRGREVAGALERIRLVFRKALVNLAQDPRLPIMAFAVRNEEGLRELLPEYWEREGPKPAGVFLAGPDEYYIVLRVDARPEFRYQLVYHEYLHLLLELNVPRVPVWLNEGLAEFWDQTVVRGSQVKMGTRNPRHIDLLRRQSMMPLRELLSMKQNPYASHPDRAGLFYAQVWALTHLLMLGAQGESAKSLGQYLGMVEEGSDPLEAFVALFGDLDAMDKKLEHYVRETRLTALQMEAPEKVDDDSFDVTVLSNATAAALRGNFLESGSRPDAALPLLERALALAPGNSLVLESMGFYYYRKQQYEAAKEWLSKATSLNSGSFLCHYYLALLLSRGQGDADQAKEGMRRSIELNPKFAPAYAELGRLYAATGVPLESAYGLAAKAAELEPDHAWYWVNVGKILLRMEKLAEASDAAERASRVARTEGLRVLVKGLQREITSHGNRVAEDVVTDTDAPVANSIETPSPRRRAVGDRRIEGRFAELRCRDGGKSFDFVLVSKGLTSVFHTHTLGSIRLMEKGESVTRDMNCGRHDSRVAVIYTPASEPSGKGVHGELRVLEFLP